MTEQPVEQWHLCGSLDDWWDICRCPNGNHAGKYRVDDESAIAYLNQLEAEVIALRGKAELDADALIRLRDQSVEVCCWPLRTCLMFERQRPAWDAEVKKIGDALNPAVQEQPNGE